jgi:hypothetical protein
VSAAVIISIVAAVWLAVAFTVWCALACSCSEACEYPQVRR